MSYDAACALLGIKPDLLLPVFEAVPQPGLVGSLPSGAGLWCGRDPAVLSAQLILHLL